LKALPVKHLIVLNVIPLELEPEIQQ